MTKHSNHDRMGLLQAQGGAKLIEVSSDLSPMRTAPQRAQTGGERQLIPDYVRGNDAL